MRNKKLQDFPTKETSSKRSSWISSRLIQLFYPNPKVTTNIRRCTNSWKENMKIFKTISVSRTNCLRTKTIPFKGLNRILKRFKDRAPKKSTKKSLKIWGKSTKSTRRKTNSSRRKQHLWSKKMTNSGRKTMIAKRSLWSLKRWKTLLRNTKKL